MNLNELSQKLEDHLTDQDIQDAQELLDDTYQEIVDMRGELVEAQAELAALRTQAVADAAEIDQLNKACDQRAAHEYKLMGEIDALKAQNADLLAAQEGTQCKHKFHVDAGGVLFCVYCSASFSEQQQAIAKARGESV